MSQILPSVNNGVKWTIWRNTVSLKTNKEIASVWNSLVKSICYIWEEGKQVWGASNQTEKLLRQTQHMPHSWNWNLYSICATHTDKKENQIFLIDKEIKEGSVAKSYMVKYLRISSYIKKPFLEYDLATNPNWISLYMRKFSFLFYQCTKYS